jgi:hypothetical protein
MSKLWARCCGHFEKYFKRKKRLCHGEHEEHEEEEMILDSLRGLRALRGKAVEKCVLLQVRIGQALDDTSDEIHL